MGGLGSGRPRHGVLRRTTDDLLSIDVRAWCKAKALNPGYEGIVDWKLRDEVVASVSVRASSHHLSLSYSHRVHGRGWLSNEVAVPLVRTRLHLGGSRLWFLCPAKSCGRRVAILYFGPDLGCRHCHGITYSSTRDTHQDRLVRRLNRLRQRLGWRVGLVGGKPKWMRRRTFESLTHEFHLLLRESLVMCVTQAQR